MPQDPVVWIALTFAVAVVVIVALWLGDVVEVRLRPVSLKFKRAERMAERGRMSVASHLRIKKAKVGDIAGRKVEGADAPEDSSPMDVARDAVIEDSEVRDVVGIKHVNSRARHADGDADPTRREDSPRR